jgi:hypothetical protein
MADDQIRQAERARPTDELGASGLMSFFGQLEEAYLAELRWPSAYAKYNEMRRRDPTIASLLNATTLLSRSATWTVEPAGTSELDKQAAEFLEQNLGDMSLTIEDTVEDALTALPFGWSWSEIVYKRRKGPSADPASKYDDGKIGWRKFAPRRQSSFYKWQFDESGGVQGLWQSIPLDAQPTRYIPIQKSLHFTAQRDQGNPEGIALLEPIYEAWHFVKNLQIILGIGWERSFVGLPKFTYGTFEQPYTPTDDDKALVAKTGKGLRVDEKAYVAVPGNIGFELVTSENTGAAALLDTIKHYRITMLTVVLADFLALGTTASGGSYSLGQDKSALFLMAVDGWLDKIAHVDKLGILNRYAVPRLFSYNTFDGITDYPRIKHSTVQKPSMEALGTYLQSLSTFITPDFELEKELRKVADLPAPEKKLRPVGPNPATHPNPASNPNAPNPANGPETGDQTGSDGSAQMADPHPPARGQRWFEVRWSRLEREFRKAMGQHA